MLQSKLLVLFSILLFTYTPAQSQYFNIYRADVGDYPKIKLFYNAHNGYYAVEEDDIEFSDFTLRDDGVDMALFEDGKQNLVRICEYLPEGIPISVVFMLDRSYSMGEPVAVGPGVKIDLAKEAAKKMLDSINFDGGSEAAVIGFSGKVTHNAGWKTTRQELKDSIDRIKIGTTTDFNEAFDSEEGKDGAFNDGAFQLFDDAKENTRRIIIFISDGKHESAVIPFRYEEFIQTSIEKRVTVFAVTFSGELNQDLRELSQRTGGQYFRPYSGSALDEIYRQLFAEVSSGAEKCWLEYTAPLACLAENNTKEIVVDYTGLNQPYSSTITYQAPEEKLKYLEVLDSEIIFEDAPNVSKSIKVTSHNSSMSVSFSIYPDDGNFELPPPATLSKDFQANLFIKYLGINPGPKEYDFMINGDCPSPEIKLKICGGTAPANYDFGDVSITASSEQTVAFTNDGFNSISGVVRLGGVDKDRFAVKAGD